MSLPEGRVVAYSVSLRRGLGAVGSAPPCQGGGRGFEPRSPLHGSSEPTFGSALFCGWDGLARRDGARLRLPMRDPCRVIAPSVTQNAPDKLFGHPNRLAAALWARITGRTWREELLAADSGDRSCFRAITATYAETGQAARVSARPTGSLTGSAGRLPWTPATTFMSARSRISA